MAFPTAINDQITDSITQVNTEVIGNAPAVAMGNFFEVTSQALSNVAHNATNNQQEMYITTQASTTMGIASIYSMETASAGVAAANTFNS